MKKKSLELIIILIGVIILSLAWLKITSYLGVERIFGEPGKETLEAKTIGNIPDLLLNVSKTRKSGNWYGWDQNTVGEERKVWKIANFDGSVRNYNDLYYCLNATLGFGNQDGQMAEGAVDTYKFKVDMKSKNNEDIEYIKNQAKGIDGTITSNYNKILWILNNLYIPTGENNYKDSANYKELMNKAGISIDEKDWDITEEEIEIVQQMAIWYFTNGNDGSYHLTSGNLPSMYKNGNQLSSIYYETDKYGEQKTGAITQRNMEKLFKYFIENANEQSTYTASVPNLTLSNNNAVISDSEDYYIAGPFALAKENITVDDMIVKIDDEELSASDFLITSSKNSTSNITDYSNLENFYIKIQKSKITGSSTIYVDVSGTYKTKSLIFYTNGLGTAQPVVKVEETSGKLSDNKDIEIRLTNYTVNKVWEDNNNQDAVRPEDVKVQLYKNTVPYGNKITLNSGNNWSYTWKNLLLDENTTKFEVRELNSSNNVVLHEQQFDENYKAVYVEENNKTIIINAHVPGKTTVEVEKIWNDENNIDGVRPIEVKVQLYKNGTAFGDSITLNESNEWKNTWSNLELKENGTVIKYEVKELNSSNEKVEGKEAFDDNYTATYVVEGNKTIITNTHIAEKTSVEVEKKWEDQRDYDGLRPTEVKVQLYKNGTAFGDSITLNDSNSWKHSWTELQTKENGIAVEYKVRELNSRNEAVEDGEDFNENYKATYKIINNKTEITNTHEVIQKTGKYSIIARKVDETGRQLSGAKIKINNTMYTLGEAVIEDKVTITSGDSFVLSYDIEEEKAPEGYKAITNKHIRIKLDIKEENNSYTVQSASLVDESNRVVSDDAISLSLTQSTNTIAINIKNELEPEKLDLSLRKFITKVNDTTYNREPEVDASVLNKVGSDAKMVTTAIYKHSKKPILAQKSDIVTYTIRVYNEGKVNGYAEIITDYLPDNIVPLVKGPVEIDEVKYKDEIEFNESKWLWIYSNSNNSVSTTITSKANSDTYALLTGKENVQDTELNAYVDGSNELDYIDVELKCLVTGNARRGEYLTNIAEITDSMDSVNEIHTDGEDSNLANVDKSNLSTYKNEFAIDSTPNSYIPGQEDDDDFEKLLVEEFDLSLRKFIIKVDDKTYTREPVVDASKLGVSATTAIYTHTKEPVIVETGNYITYKIRVYNEGTIEGFANEITDDIPEGLEFLPDSSTNVTYGWKMIDENGNETTDLSKAKKVVTNYLSENNKNNEIPAISENEEGSKVLSYKDVEVQFKVIATPKKQTDNIIKNVAQISEDSNRDIDSKPDRNEQYDYKNGKNEDDIDYEPIKLQYFDLALKKFVTKVNTLNFNNRYPEVIFNDDGTVTYNQTKAPVLVETNSTVVYTIRVYNEGEKPGTATEISDKITGGLEYLPDNELNKQYGWKLIDSDGKVTDDITKAVKFTTDILKDDTIAPISINNGVKMIEYKDVQIAFKVTAKDNEDRILINSAEISKDNGDDIDSTPDNNDDKEDDQDKEYIKVEYFDLSLKKWITETRVTFNDKTTTTKTGFDEDTDKMAKVDVIGKNISKTTIKFVYNIKVINEGEVPGAVGEIKDYIPNGLEFNKEDNEKWTLDEDGNAVTDQLKDTIINPGESATVTIVLTWKNTSTNMGVKTNYAEISKDSGNDVDSVPDNFNKEEDDIDDAQVIISIKTAGPRTYIGLLLICVVIIGGGVTLIKKYIVD